MIAPIHAVLTGKSRPLRGAEERSAIAKTPASGALMLGPLGFAGDEQADLLHHGGPDKAVHHYPAEHYVRWREELGEHPLLYGPGGFGENIATSGLLESGVCIGDVFRLGAGIVEVSQGRQPCWKVSHRFGMPTLAGRMVTTGRVGWYYRVLQPGRVAVGEGIELVERPLPEWTVARVFELLIGGKGRSEPDALAALAAMDRLASPWRHRAAALQR